MKFKDKISFLTYLTSPENFGDLNVEYEGSMGSYGEIKLWFKNSEKVIPKSIEEKLYEIIDIDFLNSDKIENYPNIDSQSYTFSHVDGVIDISDGSYSTAHSFEEDEIRTQLKELLDEILFEDYSISLTISGTYKGYNKEPTLSVEYFYLGIIDKNDEERTFDDIGDNYKNQILSRLADWAPAFSNSSSSGEYTFKTYNIQLNECGYYENFDSSYRFFESNNNPLLDISILEEDEDEDSEEFEIDFN